MFDGKLDHNYQFFTKCDIYMDTKNIMISPIGDYPHIIILIDRNTLEITKNTTMIHIGAFYLGRVEGIIGIKQLIKRSYLIAIGASINLDTPNSRSRDVHKIDSIVTFPIQEDTPRRDESYRDQQEWQWEQIYLNMIRDLFKKCDFYYSASYDLTNSAQKNAKNFIDKKGQPNCLSNETFQWNHDMLKLFDSSDRTTARCRLPIIMGFYTKKTIDTEKGLHWELISRRNVKRAGTRFNRRGVDDNGNVANYVETEQIVSGPYGNSSHVQIRGSIPMYWSQTPTYKYKPAIKIHDRDHEAAMVKHYRNIKLEYGELSVACLIDQKGHEAQLSHEFNKRMCYLQNSLKIYYHYFDFHKECGKLRWHKLSTLMEKLEPELTLHRFFKFEYDRREISSTQKGVVRSNCIDSLDRTNVVQSMIAQCMLDNQLRSIDGRSLDQLTAFMQTFKDAWADHADALSIQYAGTPALKTDFTRTGQRTYKGMLRDGFNSATRYISNNYLDNYQQDSMDLILGNFDGYPSPTYRPIDLASYSSTFPIAIVMLTLVALYVYFRHDSMRLLDN